MNTGISDFLDVELFLIANGRLPKPLLKTKVIKMKCPHCNKPINPKIIAAHMGKLGGSKTSESKKKSSAANGKLGGRPKKIPEKI
ncbi:MAG: hypothetical protein KBC72_00475 [Acinetobacter sp.]|nr:hypothetical protein [Acinetobacter sp.]